MDNNQAHVARIEAKKKQDQIDSRKHYDTMAGMSGASMPLNGNWGSFHRGRMMVGKDPYTGEAILKTNSLPLSSSTTSSSGKFTKKGIRNTFAGLVATVTVVAIAFYGEFSPKTEPKSWPGSFTHYITDETLTIRQGPGANHAIDNSLQLKKGDCVEVISWLGKDWAKVSHPHLPEATQHYVAGTQIKRLGLRESCVHRRFNG